MLGKFLKLLQCVKTRVKRRNENKLGKKLLGCWKMRRNFQAKKINFYKFIWLYGEENNFLRFYEW